MPIEFTTYLDAWRFARRTFSNFHIRKTGVWAYRVHPL